MKHSAANKKTDSEFMPDFGRGMKKHIKSEKGKAKPIACPECGSLKTSRVQRTLTEKLLCFITGKRYAYRKYYCKSCESFSLRSYKQSIEDGGISEDKVSLEEYSEDNY